MKRRGFWTIVVTATFSFLPAMVTPSFFKIEGCMFPVVQTVITDWIAQHGCRK